MFKNPSQIARELGLRGASHIWRILNKGEGHLHPSRRKILKDRLAPTYTPPDIPPLTPEGYAIRQHDASHRTLIFVDEARRVALEIHQEHAETWRTTGMDIRGLTPPL